MKKALTVLLFLVLTFSCETAEKEDISTKVNYIKSPSLENCVQPFLFSNNKELFMSWTHKINDSITSLNYSKLINNKWSNPIEIIKGKDWFVNWADFSTIAENNGNVLSHFLPKSEDGTFTYDIYLKQFNKKDSLWQNEFILHDDGTKSEHGFVTMLPYKNDSFFITWLDGRNTSGGHDYNGAGAMTIRATEVSADGKKSNETELDAKTCDCCQTSAAITENGPIVVYRDRSDNEIRDINITRLIDGSWTTPVTIHSDNWKIDGCPVNGPKAANYQNNLVVAWYTEAEEIPTVKLIFSKDNGVTFDEPAIIDKIKTIGRVGVNMIDNESALVSWVTSEDSRTVIKAVKVHISGKKENPVIVSEFDPSRSSGFPQLEILDGKAYFAWTDVSGESPMIKIAFLNLENL